MLEIEVLPFRLALVSIQPELLPRFMHILLKTIFQFNNSNNDNNQAFVSFTQTPREISLILDVSTVAEMDLIQLSDTDTLKYRKCQQPWRCMQVFPGESGGEANDMNATVNKISAPLAARGISIFQVSTFSSDFTLVAEQDLSLALACLKTLFKLTVPGLSIDSDRGYTPMPLNNLPLYQKQKHPIIFDCTKSSLYVVGIRQPQDYLRQLLQMIFYPDPRVPFFSLTKAFGDTSLILDSFNLSLLPTDACSFLTSTSSDDLVSIDNNNNDNEWCAMEVGEPESDIGLGFDEPGIVSAVTQPLSKQGLQCYYLSTYRSDFILTAKQSTVMKQVKSLLE